MILVDTNVLLDVIQNDPRWGDWSARQMNALLQAYPLVINAIVYAELATSFSSAQELDARLTSTRIDLVEMPRLALFLAGQAVVHYRRRGGNKTSVLPDFFIGAHAAANGWALLTRDAVRIRSYFPTVRVIAPDS